jgi:hypothetical protein
MCVIEKDVYHSTEVCPQFIEELKRLHHLHGNAYRFVETQCPSPRSLEHFRGQLATSGFPILAEKAEILVKLNKFYARKLIKTP